MSFRKRVVTYILLALFITGVMLFVIGSALIMPMQHTVTGDLSGLTVESVSFSSQSGSLIRGWFLPGKRASAVVLMHGVRADRGSMLARAKLLNAHGYNVLLFDFQAHGESKGDYITFGYLESRDATAAVDYLRTQKHLNKIGALGVSMGAASLLLADGAHANAAVVEAAYTDIDDAIRNRLRIYLGHAGIYLAPLLECQLKWRLGIEPNDLAPLKHISRIHVPILIIAGGEDMRAPLAGAQALYKAANEPKELWVIKEAGHLDFMRNLGDAYNRKILAFFDSTLQ